MGEGTRRVESANELEAEIEQLREELDPLVAEVDRRRHQLLDVRGHLRRHARTIATVGLGAAALLGAVVWLGIRRAQARNRMPARASRLRAGVARMMEHPERVAAESTLGEKLVAAAATTVMSAIARKGLERVLDRALTPDRQPGALPPAERWTGQAGSRRSVA